ncbi:MAG: hypothetical protein E6Q97_36310 [Desulfurellales bacterium]|nr:MAG: hypothetical protein E6Q97_36310 [Desulfurellales bacterium]
MIIQRAQETESPRLNVSFLGREYSGALGAKSFSVTATLTNIFDGWTLDLPIGPDDINEDIPSLNVHRWKPIIFTCSDPLVDSGKPVPMVMGVCTKVEHHTSAEASVLRLSGFDLGKLLDSCAKPWIRFRGLRLKDLITKLIDPSWIFENRNDGWGIHREPRGLNVDRVRKLGQRVTGGRAGVQLAQQAVIGQILPPLQTEVGQTVYDIISRYARLNGITTSTGSFVSVSSDGYIQIFNPNDYVNDPPLYVFHDTDDERNIRIKRSSLILDGDDLYTDYACYGSVIIPPQALKPNKVVDFNAGKFSGRTGHSSILGTDTDPITRSLTFADPEQYVPRFAKTRAEWRKKQSLYKEQGIRLTIQGHSMPGPDGKWLPLVEGNMAELFSTRLRRWGRYIIEQVVKRQDANTGTECDVTLRLPGLLGP